MPLSYIHVPASAGSLFESSTIRSALPTSEKGSHSGAGPSGPSGSASEWKPLLLGRQSRPARGATPQKAWHDGLGPVFVTSGGLKPVDGECNSSSTGDWICLPLAGFAPAFATSRLTRSPVF